MESVNSNINNGIRMIVGFSGTIYRTYTESLLASQSAFGPHWGRSVSRKRDRPELVDLCQEEYSSEGERPELGRQPTTLAHPVDKGYD